jgi:hypothetical protein
VLRSRLWLRRPVEDVEDGALQVAMRNLVVGDDSQLLRLCLKDVDEEAFEELIPERVAIRRDEVLSELFSVELCS